MGHPTAYPHITPTQLLDTFERVINEFPDRLNPVMFDECVYTGEDGTHCIAGEVFLRLGIKFPDEGQSAGFAFGDGRFGTSYQYGDSHDDRAVIVNIMQRAADTGRGYGTIESDHYGTSRWGSDVVRQTLTALKDNLPPAMLTDRLREALRRHALVLAMRKRDTVRFYIDRDNDPMPYEGTVEQVVAEEFTVRFYNNGKEATYGYYDVEDLSIERKVP